ncbi:MAG TPA: hypothetical protein VGC82_02080 [Rhodopila sp.]
MLRLPSRFAAVILTFAPMFVQQRTWWHAQLLLLGAILTPGQRTVSQLVAGFDVNRGGGHIDIEMTNRSSA